MLYILVCRALCSAPQGVSARPGHLHETALHSDTHGPHFQCLHVCPDGRGGQIFFQRSHQPLVRDQLHCRGWNGPSFA